MSDTDLIGLHTRTLVFATEQEARADAAEARLRDLEALGAPPDDSEQSHYNTCRRAREWWHANTGLTGEAATGRFLLGWVLETVYAQRKLHADQIAALKLAEGL